MAQYTLEAIDNTIEPSSQSLNEVKYKIVCTPTEVLKIKTVTVDLSVLGNYIDWVNVTGKITGSKCKLDVNTKTVAFTFDRATEFKTGSTFTFSIRLPFNTAGGTPPAEVAIEFRLVDSDGGKVDKAECKGSKIFINVKKPVIKKFRLYPSVVRKYGNISLYMDCENVKTCTVTYEDGTILQNGTKKADASDNCNAIIKNVQTISEKGAMFYLKAENGSMIAIENSVREITKADPGWQKVAMYETVGGVTVVSDIKDLVLNEYDDKIWAFAIERGSDKAALWYSENGIKWAPYMASRQKNGDTVEEKAIIPDKFLHCPAVHFRGKIYFVCGSKVDVDHCSPDIYEWNYATNAAPRVVATDEGAAKPKARSLHGLAVYKGSIWIIGGIDKNGNGLKDAWKFSGNRWEEQTVPGDFPKRCGFSTAVEVREKTDDTGRVTEKIESIWIGGGTKNYGGDTLADIWRYDSNGWKTLKNVNKEMTQVNPIKFTAGWLNASAISFLDNKNYMVTNCVVDGNTMVMPNGKIVFERPATVKGVDELSYLLSEDRNSTAPGWNDATSDRSVTDNADNFVLASLGFNGCVWLMAVVYRPGGVIETSDLFYSCPE